MGESLWMEAYLALRAGCLRLVGPRDKAPGGVRVRPVGLKGLGKTPRSQIDARRGGGGRVLKDSEGRSRPAWSLQGHNPLRQLDMDF